METVASSVKIICKEDFNSVCRLCLMEGPLASIFDLKYEETSFSEILSDLFCTKVNKDDEMPKNICETCITEIIRFYNFRKVFSDSEKTLQSIIAEELNKTRGSVLCKEEIVSEDSILNNDLVDDLIEIKEDPLNNEIHESNNLDEDKIKIDNITTDTEKSQDNCSTETANSDRETQHLGNGVKKLSLSKASEPQIFVCSCQETFTLESEYIKHKKQEKHPRPRSHSCQICSKNFDYSSLKLHMRIHTKERPYECEICKKKFSFNSNFKRHTLTHTGEKPHVCEFCGKGFIRAPSLTNHKRIHTGERPFLCTHCGKTYANSIIYQQHLKLHQNGEEKSQSEWGYSCTVCRRTFSQKGSLKMHVLTHTGDKPYKCKICSKAFTQRSHREAHLRTHSGERPYVCPHCNKNFPHSATLKVHIRTHTGERPYVCDLCSMGFHDSSSMKRHRKRHRERPGVREGG